MTCQPQSVRPLDREPWCTPNIPDTSDPFTPYYDRRKILTLPLLEFLHGTILNTREILKKPVNLNRLYP